MIRKITTIEVITTEGTNINLKEHFARAVIVMYHNLYKVEAIKFLRAEFELGLKEAKDLAEEIYTERKLFGLDHLYYGNPNDDSSVDKFGIRRN